MILVNVKSYAEMVTVANYINPEHYPANWKFLDYEQHTVMILENSDWDYTSIQLISTQEEYKHEKIITFEEFTYEYLLNKTESTDDIHKPSHYQLPDGTQVKEHIASLTADMKGVRAWATGNAIKYLARAGKKDDIIKDLKKAQENIQIIIDDIEKENN